MTTKAATSTLAAKAGRFLGEQINGAIFGAVIAAFVAIAIGYTPDDFLKRTIVSFWRDQLTPTIQAQAFKTAHSPQWEMADSATYNWLLEVFGRQMNFARTKPRYEEQPFRVANQRFGKWDMIYVLWIDQCTNDGCRLDVIEWGNKKPEGTVYTRAVKLSSVGMNGKPVLYDINGKYIFFDGSSYVSQ